MAKKKPTWHELQARQERGEHVPVGTPFAGLSGLRGWQIPPETREHLRVLAEDERASRNSDIVFTDKPNHR